MKKTDNSYQLKLNKFFSPWMLLLCIVGLAINLILSKLVIYFNLPLYIDTVGSIIVAALGGPLPGVIVGFLSNSLGSISEPISLFYSVLTIIIALIASALSKRGMFKKLKGFFIALACFVFIGGAVGSVMTWFLYGGGIGGIAEPYATALFNKGCPAFLSQLICDIVIDIPDKAISLGIVFLALHFYPEKLNGKFPLSYIYEKGNSSQLFPEHNYILKHSINNRIMAIFTVSITLVNVLAATIGTVYHHRNLIKSYKFLGETIAQNASACINGDKVKAYIDGGESVSGYTEDKAKLQQIFDNSKSIAYLYVYDVRKDGCHVVFDLDTKDVKANKPGDVIENEKYFYDNMDDFLAGKQIEPDFTIGKYGSLITAYSPIQNTAGETVAYAGADIDFGSYIRDLSIFIIQLVSVLFACSLVIYIFMLWFTNRNITEPIRIIVDQSNELNKISPEKWLESEEWKSRTPITSGDEIEELYNTVCSVEETASLNVQKLIQAKEANQYKTDFLSRMSHDIRTPLNAILGTANLAKDETDNPQAMTEALETIDSSGHFLLGLINDILDINKIEIGKIELHPEPYSYAEFHHIVMDTFSELATVKNIDFQIVKNTPHRCVLVDRLRFNQIFFNLLSNSIKYTPQNGKIELLMDDIDAPNDLLGMRCIVKDNGIGMSREYMKHLFEPFTRDESAEINQTEGTGLGLAIVKNIVDTMGGKISVKSELGKGTEFTVDLFLPIADKSVMDMHLPEQSDDSVMRGKHILIAEDNEINAKIAKRLLLKKECKVSIAQNGKNAVETYLSADDNSIDLILMDIRMPVMNGIDAAKTIRSSGKPDSADIPIVAMTADAFNEDIIKTKNAGMNAHISKPIEPKILYETLDALLSE